MGFMFKPKLSALLAFIHGLSAALTYIATKGDLTTTILLLAVSTGITAGINYYKKEETNE